MSGASSVKKYHHIAQQRAQQFKKVRQESKLHGTRARSQDGQPVAYQKVKEEANIRRRSRVMSDPDIPSTLVILNAKGLFQGKNGSQPKPDIRPASVNIMDKGASRPVFFDSSINSKEAKVSDLRKRFEAVEHDIGGSNLVNNGGDFLNPLHKVNQDPASRVRTKLTESVQQKPDRICGGEIQPIEYQSKGQESNKGSDSLNVLHKASQDLSLAADDKSKKNVQKVLGNLDVHVCVKKPVPPPKSNKVLTVISSEPAVRESAVKSPPLYPPPRPPPRPPKRDPLKRCRGESDPMPLDENRVSRILHVTTHKSLEENIQEENVPQQSLETNDALYPPPCPPPRPPTRDPLKHCRGESDPMLLDENRVSRILHVTTHKSLEENIQEENVPQQSLETNDAVNGTETNGHSSSGENVNDDGDNEDDDDWGTDFDDDNDIYDDVEDDEVYLKRDSQSSHESSCDVEPLEFPDAVSKKLYNIASEILTTERAYVRRLHLLDQVFHLRLNNECCVKGILPTEAINDIFSNIQAIHQLHRDFLLPKLEARMKEWSTNNQIGDILKELAPFLKMYTLYVGNFDKATETLSSWMKKSPIVTGIIDEIQKSKECENLTLQHHMLEPVQRVPRYQLLLKDYLSKLPEDSKDLKNTSDALDIIAESARHANDSMKKTERFKILLEIQEKIGVDYPLITASRELVMEGDFKKVAARTSDIHQERTLMLFNDLLLCCAKFPGTNKYKVKVEMDLYGMEVDTVDEDLEMENAFRITSKQRVMDFTAPTAEAKETFMNKLRETVNELTNKRESYKRGNKIEVMKEGDLGKKAPAWVRDEAVSMCMLCDIMFTRFRRRHHCRACGRVVCGNCSSLKAALEYKNGKLEKVCEVCHRILVKGSSEENAKESKVKGNSILKIGSDSKIWHSGYLSFKTKGDKGWQKRWFVLSSDFVLFRYKAKKDMKAEFNLPLPGHNVDKPTLADEVDGKNVFKVHHKNLMVFWFQAESEESMNRWMELLTRATKAEQIDEEQPTGEKKIQRANSS